MKAKPSTSRAPPLHYRTIGQSDEWLRIPKDESIIITDSQGKLITTYNYLSLIYLLGNIELAVIRGFSGNQDVLESVNTTIAEAIKDRNNVRVRLICFKLYLLFLLCYYSPSILARWFRQAIMLGLVTFTLGCSV